MSSVIVLGERGQIVMIGRGATAVPSYLKRTRVDLYPQEVMEILDDAGYTVRRLDPFVLVGVSEASVTDAVLHDIALLVNGRKRTPTPKSASSQR